MNTPSAAESPLLSRPRSLRARNARILFAIALLALPTAGLVALRRPILRAAGDALVAQDALAPAEVIVVGTHTGPAGVLEAADLVRGGVAARVAVFADPPNPADQEFLRRGLPYEDATARMIRQLQSLGVEAVEVIPREVSGSEDEARVLPGWCEQHQVRSVLVISTPDHSRRLRRLLRRTMQGRPTRVAVWPTRYSEFDPKRWWQTRDGTRTEVIELQKLLLDIALHPMS